MNDKKVANVLAAVIAIIIVGVLIYAYSNAPSHPMTFLLFMPLFLTFGAFIVIFAIRLIYKQTKNNEVTTLKEKPSV